MARDVEPVLTGTGETHPVVDVELNGPGRHAQESETCGPVPEPGLASQWIDGAVRWRHAEMFVRRAVAWGHVDLIAIADGRAETELNRNSLANSKLTLLAHHGNMENDVGISRGFGLHPCRGTPERRKKDDEREAALVGGFEQQMGVHLQS